MSQHPGSLVELSSTKEDPKISIQQIIAKYLIFDRKCSFENSALTCTLSLEQESFIENISKLAAWSWAPITYNCSVTVIPKSENVPQNALYFLAPIDLSLLNAVPCRLGIQLLKQGIASQWDLSFGLGLFTSSSYHIPGLVTLDSRTPPKPVSLI